MIDKMAVTPTCSNTYHIIYSTVSDKLLPDTMQVHSQRRTRLVNVSALQRDVSFSLILWYCVAAQ